MIRVAPGVVTFAALTLAAVAFYPAQAQAQTSTPAALHSASEYLSPELKAEQADDFRNRGMLWVEQGAALWTTPVGPKAQACAACHGAPEKMRGVAARLPAVDDKTGRLVNLEGRINQCRTQRQGAAEPLAYESNDLLALTVLIARQSHGLPLAVATEGPAAPYLASGAALWRERQGQLNVSCAQCHDDNVGRKLRGDTISSAVPTGYPVYRLEWQGMGSLHRRLRACQLGVRAIQFPQGAPEYLALELYLAARAKGALLEAPALRR